MQSLQNPQLLLKIGNQPEFNIADKVQGLKYLGDNSTPTINNSYLDVPGIMVAFCNTQPFLDTRLLQISF